MSRKRLQTHRINRNCCKGCGICCKLCEFRCPDFAIEVVCQDVEEMSA